MISQFIDGLVHYHFLQNALITAVAIGVVAGEMPFLTPYFPE